MTTPSATQITVPQPAGILDAGDVDYLAHSFPLPQLREQAHICEVQQAVSRLFGEDHRADYYLGFRDAFRLAAEVRRSLERERAPATAGRPGHIDVASIKALTDIVEVASRFTTLRKSGRNFVGLCPLHDERAPSFYVYPDAGRFHCYGCGADGDVLELMMQVEHLDFRAAAEMLR